MRTSGAKRMIELVYNEVLLPITDGEVVPVSGGAGSQAESGMFISTKIFFVEGKTKYSKRYTERLYSIHKYHTCRGTSLIFSKKFEKLLGNFHKYKGAVLG